MATEVFFGTNRNVKKRNQDQEPIDFGIELNNEKPLLHFGKAEISDNGENLEKVHTSKNTSSEELCCSQDIFNEIEDRMCRGIDTIVFFHGFYNSFESSLIGAAELKRLYETEGNREYTMIALSWPSDGELLFAYDDDRRDARESRKVLGAGFYKMSQFLIELCWLKYSQKTISDTGRIKNVKNKSNRTKCGRLHIMAHSMGNYVLRHVLQELCKITGGRIPQLFDEILLIAADEDEDSFEHKNKFKFLPELAKRISVYFNQADIPLIISDLFMGNMDRLGSEGPRKPHKIPTNVSLINCKNVAKGLLRHDYHKTESGVRKDISYVLAGKKSEDIPSRIYFSETNSYHLIDSEQATQPDILVP